MLYGFNPILVLAHLPRYFLLKCQHKQADEGHYYPEYLIQTEGLIEYEIVKCCHYNYWTLNDAVWNSGYADARTDIRKYNGQGCEESNGKRSYIFNER